MVAPSEPPEPSALSNVPAECQAMRMQLGGVSAIPSWSRVGPRPFQSNRRPGAHTHIGDAFVLRLMIAWRTSERSASALTARRR